MTIHNTRTIINEGAQIEAYIQPTVVIASGFSSTRIWIVQLQATETARRSRTNCIV